MISPDEINDKGIVNLSGRVTQIYVAGRCPRDLPDPIPQISAQMWNLWLLEALSPAAVT